MKSINEKLSLYINKTFLDLSINNVNLILSSFPKNLLDINDQQTISYLNILTNLLKGISKKINSSIIIDIKLNEPYPKTIDFYQAIYTFFYSFLTNIFTNDQFCLVRFPQLLKVGSLLDFDCKVSFDSKTVEINTEAFSFETNNSDQLNDEASHIIKNIDKDKLAKTEELFSYGVLCFAGTFDHYHIGHNILLQLSLLLSNKTIYIGITSDNMVKHKGNKYILQTEHYRKANLNKIIELNGVAEGTKYEIMQINDPISFAGYLEEINVLVLTAETIKGGEVVNETRKKNNVSPVHIVTLNIVHNQSHFEEQKDKISSSTIRKSLNERISEDKLSYLYDHWIALCKKCDVNDEDKILDWWNEIRDEYLKKWKHYHTLVHVYQMLKLAEENSIDAPEILYAIWFHDIIYVPSRKDNEKLSSEKFYQFSSDCGDQLKIDKYKVMWYINETANHCEDKQYDDENIKILLDMDMAILAGENIEEYEKQIREEFCFCSEEEYKKGRSEFLSSTLKKKEIYLSELFRKKLEEKARKNITTLLSLLSS